MRIAIIIAWTFVLVGCASKFEIVELNKFSEPSEPRKYGSVGNQLCHLNSQGLVSKDDRKIYLNPVVIADYHSEARVILMYFENVIHHPGEAFAIEKIVFVDDKDQKLVLRFNEPDRDLKAAYDKVLYDKKFYSEKAVALISKENLEQLCWAEEVEAKIFGKRRDLVLAKDDICESFLDNLRRFLLFLEKRR